MNAAVVTIRKPLCRAACIVTPSQYIEDVLNTIQESSPASVETIDFQTTAAQEALEEE